MDKKDQPQPTPPTAKVVTVADIRAAAGGSLRKSTFMKVNGKAVHVLVKKRRINNTVLNKPI